MQLLFIVKLLEYKLSESDYEKENNRLFDHFKSFRITFIKLLWIQYKEDWKTRNKIIFVAKELDENEEAGGKENAMGMIFSTN